MDWKECCQRRIVKEVKIDEDLITSLKKTSDNKIKSSDELKMNEVNSSSKIILAYDSLREILEALSIKKGYKIYNHECYVAFIKEILKESEKGEDFDEIRKIRNNLNYYGKTISLNEAVKIIESVKILRNYFLGFFNHMKVGVLFSGGKDSVYSAYLAKKEGHELACLITMVSKNIESYMFHTPSIKKTEIQAKAMELPLVFYGTEGIKEKELEDLKDAVKLAKEKYGIEGIVTGAIKSVYQSSRIQKICDELGLKCLNPLWEKDEFEFLEELIENNFEVLIIGIFAYPLDESWLGRRIDGAFIKDVKKLHEKYKVHPAGEGGEIETFVLNCPLFKKRIEVKKSEKIMTGENSGFLNLDEVCLF